MRTVPTIDIDGTRNGDTSAASSRMDDVARALDAACTASGFFIVTGHGVDPGLVADVMDVARNFFYLPAETIPTTITPGRPAKYGPVLSGEWIKAKSMSMLEEHDS